MNNVLEKSLIREFISVLFPDEGRQRQPTFTVDLGNAVSASNVTK